MYTAMFTTQIMLRFRTLVSIDSCEAFEFGTKVFCRYLSCHSAAAFLSGMCCLLVSWATYQYHIEVHKFFCGLKTYYHISLCVSIPNDKAPMIANSTLCPETNN